MRVTPLASSLAGDQGSAADDPVRLYYSRKTDEILQKYGPGPRVHFHVGLYPDGPPAPATLAQSTLKQRLVDAQERIVGHAARSWGAYDSPPRRVLDIGCGLGGTSLYWAQEHRSSVTGLTIAAEHVPLVRRFARQAGVGDRVRPLLADVHDLDDVRAYDAAYANESSGYTDRARLFEVVARALEPGGWFGIQEHFLCDTAYSDFLDGYYRTRLATRKDYLVAAEAAGFELVQDEDVTDSVAEFWVQSMAWNTAELDRLRTGGDVGGGGSVGGGGAPGAWSTERLEQSTIAHSRLFRLWRDHAVETRLLRFRIGGGR
ncbi:methyltransferase domain-containing protein [Streptomyces sp. NBC_00536]|uniref:SAM-dependent methyltransferase n=1 Tax=Streptomyces sp. NBC_00536 TaxID=2975769 RepID=UPI002E823144|nr:methyltransferase domain-containing protein [Streptomyces sp. NBC_00536]WUC77011.1 methyltransferase domain-containing protein [Streptomyces sp. NBC_00536]